MLNVDIGLLFYLMIYRYTCFKNSSLYPILSAILYLFICFVFLLFRVDT